MSHGAQTVHTVKTLIKLLINKMMGIKYLHNLGWGLEAVKMVTVATTGLDTLVVEMHKMTQLVDLVYQNVANLP